MEIYQKLLNIQSKLKAPKGQYNAFGKYKYRNCEDILEALKPLLLEEKVTLILSDSIEVIGQRYYVKATVKLIDIETEKEVSVTGYAREEESKKGMDGSQVTGASSSYARKYALNGLFDIDDTKDSDATNTGETTSSSKKSTKASATKEPAEPKEPTARDKLISALNEAGIDIKAYSKEKGLTKDTPPEIFEKLLAEFKK